jgi:SAM-dependent methyltransferase
MNAPPTSRRRRFYDATGLRYESSRYGDRHMARYYAYRDSVLSQILKDAFAPFADQRLRILEIGCGTGLSLEYLTRTMPQCSLFGMDISETMLRQAVVKTAAVAHPPRLILSDAAYLPCRDGAFDVAFTTRFIHQFDHRAKRQIWNELQRVVRRDGLIIVEFYARPYHWLRYYLGYHKGRSWDAYFQHYPSRAEVRDIVGGPFEIHPLRLVGSRVFAGANSAVAAWLTALGGRALGGIFLDEYFVVAQSR